MSTLNGVNLNIDETECLTTKLIIYQWLTHVSMSSEFKMITCDAQGEKVASQFKYMFL